MSLNDDMYPHDLLVHFFYGAVVFHNVQEWDAEFFYITHTGTGTSTESLHN